MWLLLACTIESDTKTTFTPGDFDLYVDGVDDGCAAGDLVSTFSSDGSATLDADSGSFTFPDVGTVSGALTASGGALTMRDSPLQATLLGCDAEVSVDVDLLVLSDTELSGSASFAVGGCPDFDADPCVVVVDLSLEHR